MSNVDGVDPDEVQLPEEMDLPPSPETAETREDFQDRLEANKEHIAEGVRSDDDWNDRASDIAANYSPDEIREKMEALGDQNEFAQKYEDAVFGNYDSDAEKQQAIDEAGAAWSDSVEKNEVYSMALEKFDADNEVSGGATSETTETASHDDGVDTVEPPIIPEGNAVTEQNEPVEGYHGFERGGREMSPEDEKAYNISQEIKDFVATGKDFDVLLPSQMESGGEGEDFKPEGDDGPNEATDATIETSDAIDATSESEVGQTLESQHDGLWDLFKQEDEPESNTETESEDRAAEAVDDQNMGEQNAESEYKIEIGEDGHIIQKEEDLHFQVGHNELADIKEHRNSEVGERLAESAQDNYSAESVDDAFKNINETRTDIGAIDENADKMREYTIAQGHKADYIEDFGSVKR